ncbi:MAG TPA: isoleucine--tRNA ligase, partial [Ignavibacteria bacterium]|nr:isoleucine--tRNA ligase [Ignavibacteria bacterium]
KELPDKINFSEIENEVLSFWKEDNTFDKSISSREGKPSFKFYEGPPTANGKPGIHHVISRAIKDLICRYKTLRGYQVYRKAGWDTQGLPVEIEVEKQLGIKSKDDIEKLGVDKFNQACRDSVFKYLQDWENLTERMGYWLHLEDAYITYKNEYIESVWWSLKKFFDAGLIYRGFKIQPYCPRCETPLSTHEVAQGYEDVKDPSVYVTFKIKSGQGLDGFEFLVWTTTPWTLISNVALAVGADVDYVKIQFKQTGDKVILAKDRLSVITQEYNILDEVKGKELENIEYEQLLPYVKPDLTQAGKKAFYVALGDFVTTEDGSGIVHIAPAFGEDDYQLSLIYNLPVVQPVDKSGKFTEEVTDFKGRFVKEADEDIILKLKTEHKLYRKEKITHSYPHCWRCHSPLLYYARESWYINTSSYKAKMIKFNNEINWYPPETGVGRFGNWLEENRDWALSRDRYWGTPLPIWGCSDDNKCDCKYIAIGSIEELKQKAVNFDEVYPDDSKIDLHKPYIDNIKIKCDKHGCILTRVEEVIDAWYDSGSMPFAQYHYMGDDNTPEGKLFKANYPADFIAEAIDQTRGWFYSLHAIGTFLFNDKAYKNLIVNDMILDKTGQKMSKHVGNIVNPFEVMDKYGADILRWYLISSSPPWRPKMFNEDDLKEIRNKFFDTLINTYRFFVLYCNMLGVKKEDLTSGKIPFNERPEIDRWIISALNSLKKKYIELMDGYDITRASRLLSDFTMNDLSNWYVRRNRKRFRNPENENDRNSAYSTLYEVLTELLKLVSPVSPFLSEKMYRELSGEQSVHLSYIQPPDESNINEKLESGMRIAQQIVYLVRSMRVQFNLKTRQPLKQMLIAVSSDDYQGSIAKMKAVILEEVNIKELNFVDRNSPIIKRKAKLNFKTAGPKFGKDVKKVQQAVNELSSEDINILASGNEVTSGGFKLSPEDVSIFTENIEGWIIASEGNITVAIDTTLDNELISEGIAREFISKVQNIRKERSMDVNDKIRINFTAEDDLLNAIQSKNKYIAEQTMAVELNAGGKFNGHEEININGRICKVSIEKV